MPFPNNRGYILATRIITLDVNPDHLTEVVSIRIFCHKVALCFISMLCSLESDHYAQLALQGQGLSPHLLEEEYLKTVSGILLYGRSVYYPHPLMNSIIYSSMDLKVLILCYLGYKCHVFSRFVHWWLFQLITAFLCCSVCVFVRMYMHVHVLSVSLLSGSAIYSWLILYIPCFESRLSHFSKEHLFLFIGE